MVGSSLQKTLEKCHLITYQQQINLLLKQMKGRKKVVVRDSKEHVTPKKEH